MIPAILVAACMGLHAGAQVSGSMPVPASEEHPIERLRQARLIRHEPPEFPDAALRQGIVEASVFIQLLIDLHGHVKHPHVLQCLHAGLGFEPAAVKAVKRWRYEPAELNGERIEVVQTVEVTFDAAASRPSSAMLVSAP
jgi:TonB family protein